jgi:hypothetical protein
MTISYEATTKAPARPTAAEEPAKKGVRPGQLLKIGVTVGLSAYVLERVVSRQPSAVSHPPSFRAEAEPESRNPSSWLSVGVGEGRIPRLRSE